MKRFVILLVAILLILSACMGVTPLAQPMPVPTLDLPEPDLPEPQPAPVLATPPTPQIGGHLRVPMSLPRTLNPLLNSDPWVADVLRLIFEPLVIMDGDKRPIANPALTHSIVFAEDASHLIVTLRNDIVWEDGTPITSADVAFSIETLQRAAPETAVYVPNVANFASHSIIDTLSIQINLRTPSWASMYDLAFPIISNVYYRPVSMTNLTAARNMHPLGNGPFRFHSYTLATQMELIVNHAAIGGRPYIQRVTAVIMRDLDGGDRRHAFEQGIVDILLAEPALWGRYAAAGKNRAYELVSGDFDFIAFNFNRSILTDINMRAAIAHAFDAQAVLRRYFTPADAAITPVGSASWLYAGGTATYEFDLQRTAEILAGLGFSADADGYLERRLSEVLPPVRLTLNILVSDDNTIGISIADTLSNGLRAIGVDAAVTALPFAQFADSISGGDFDLAVGGMTLGNPPDFGFLASNADEDPIARALFGYSSDDLAMLLYTKAGALSENSFRQMTRAVQHYAADNLPLLGVGFRRHVLYTTSNIHGDVQMRRGNVFANVHRWFIAE